MTDVEIDVTSRSGCFLPKTFKLIVVKFNYIQRGVFRRSLEASDKLDS